jgi:hypothetical protein
MILTSLRTRIPVAIAAGALSGTARFAGLTQVVTSRNDGYGLEPVEKLLAIVEWNRKWTKCETVFIEWNPPADRPFLSPLLTRRFHDVSCYIISPELHRQIAGSNTRPFLEYIAKNAGIRRATTDWIMVVNTDVILAPDCLLKIRKPKWDQILRTRRVDFPWAGRCPSFFSILDSRKYLRFRGIGGPDCSAPGDCTIASKELWHHARGYDEALVDKRVLCDVRGMHQLVAHGGIVKWIGTHFHFDHPESTSQGVTSDHGEIFDPKAGIPYHNPDSWGLADAVEEQIGERIWLLKPGAN